MARRLSFDERARIEAMRAQAVTAAVIARRLGRDPSTIHRETNRNGGGSYSAESAQAAADERAKRPRAPKFVADPELAAAVSAGLVQRKTIPTELALVLPTPT